MTALAAAACPTGGGRTAAAVRGGGERPLDGDRASPQQSSRESGQQAAAQQQDGQAGGESGGQQQAGELTMTDWISVDENNETATIDVVAGSGSANNDWNFNGYHAGGNNARIVPPQGYEVTVNFENQDDPSSARTASASTRRSGTIHPRSRASSPCSRAR